MAIWERNIEKSSWMSKKDKTFFRVFVEASQTKRRPIGDIRAEKYRKMLSSWHRLTGKSVLDMLKNFDALKDAVKVVNASKRYSFNTKKDLKQALGIFYNFRHNNDPSLKYAPREVKELVAHDAKPSDRRIAKEIITREDMRELLRFGNTLDKAIISLLYESGMRIGEFEQLSKTDIKQIKEGLEVRVPPGKTGERLIIVVEAKSYVNQWLEEHPSKEKDTPLLLSPDTNKVIGAAGLAKRIRNIGQRLNNYRTKKSIPVFTKPINPHNFRHSRATELGGMPGMTEQILCRYMGWEIGSDMPRTYLHLTHEQVKKAVLATYGKIRKEDVKEIPTHKICRLCKNENPIGKQYCADCGQPLDSDTQITRVGQLEEQMKEMKETMERMQQELVKADIIDLRREKEEYKKKIMGRDKQKLA